VGGCLCPFVDSVDVADVSTYGDARDTDERIKLVV
jgi:hypothetical protein